MEYNERKQPSPHSVSYLLFWHLNLASVDGVDDIVRGLAVDGAADALRGAEDLLRATGEVLGEGL